MRVLKRFLFNVSSLPTTMPLHAALLCLALICPPACGAHSSGLPCAEDARQDLPEPPAPSAEPAAMPGCAGWSGRSVEDLGRELAARFRHVRPKRWGEAMPGVTGSLAATPYALPGDGLTVVALTLDACGGGTDMRVIALVREYQVPVTLFVTTRWLRRNKKIAAELAADGLFSFAAHGDRHKPASVDGRSAFGIRGTGGIPELVREVEANARAIAAFTGDRPAWYRSGTAHYDNVAVEIIHALGLGIAGYTDSVDEGGTLPPAAVARRMLAAKHGAILLAHVNRPGGGTAAGLARSLPAMLKAGVRFIHLPRPARGDGDGQPSPAP